MKHIPQVLETLAPFIIGFWMFRGPVGAVVAVCGAGFLGYRHGKMLGKNEAEREYIFKQLTKPY